MKNLTALLFSTFFLSCNMTKNITLDIEKYLPQSDLIVEGEILMKNTSTIAANDVSNLIVIKVDEVFVKTDEFDIQNGDTITIKVTDINKAKIGVKQIFFTKKWMFGNSIGVLELWNSKSKMDAITLRGEINRQKTKMQNTLLSQRVNASDLIVTGKISKTTNDSMNIGDSEHNPEWIRATIDIDSVLKGTQNLPTTEFLFSSSIDVLWYFTPKFKENESGIWLLSKPNELIGYPKNQNYAILDKESFLQLTMLPQVIEIIKPSTNKKKSKNEKNK